MSELPRESDRSAAIVAATLVESGLEEAIMTRIVALLEKEREALFDNDAPLANFSAKIKIGRALRLYGPQTRAELDRIREIRNLFAHAKKKILFSTPEIAAMCSTLKFFDKAPDRGLPPPQTAASLPKYRFIVTCVNLWGYFKRESRHQHAVLLPHPDYMD
jgi:hypothetical protein